MIAAPPPAPPDLPPAFLVFALLVAVAIVAAVATAAALREGIHLLAAGVLLFAVFVLDGLWFSSTRLIVAGFTSAAAGISVQAFLSRRAAGRG